MVARWFPSPLAGSSILSGPANLPVAQRIVQLATNQEVVRSYRTGEANASLAIVGLRLFRNQD